MLNKNIWVIDFLVYCLTYLLFSQKNVCYTEHYTNDSQIKTFIIISKCHLYE